MAYYLDTWAKAVSCLLRSCFVCRFCLFQRLFRDFIFRRRFSLGHASSFPDPIQL